ncbi:MAG: hypothetical protein ACYTBJ_00980 [Planctomycetota bacterium]|jgi:hypothetical protein
MATDWAAEQLDAYNDIKDEGTAIIVRSKTHGTYNPVTDAATGGTITNYSTYTLITAFKYTHDQGVQSLPGDETAVQKGDRNFLIPAYGLPDMSNPAAKQEYELVYGSNVHHIIGIDTIEPGGTAILYRVHARR